MQSKLILRKIQRHGEIEKEYCHLYFVPIFINIHNIITI